jgi:hypothetical protein
MSSADMRKGEKDRSLPSAKLWRRQSDSTIQIIGTYNTLIVLSCACDCARSKLWHLGALPFESLRRRVFKMNDLHTAAHEDVGA